MVEQEDLTKNLPLWIRLRLAHDFADEDEKKQIEKLTDDIIKKHPDINKVLQNQGFTFVTTGIGQYSMIQDSRRPPCSLGGAGLPIGCFSFMVPCHWGITV